MSSGFITETEIVEARKKKQEEWERVRKADDPIEAPEQPYDARSLYERLQEQKQKKDLEFEEAHKLKNMIKGLDDDEIEFLDLVDRTKLAADRKKNLEEEKELNDYRNRVASLHEKSLNQKLQAEVTVNKSKPFSSNRLSQTKLLKGVIVTKTDSRKRKTNDNSESMEYPDNKKPKQDVVSGNGVPEKQLMGDGIPQNDAKPKTESKDKKCDDEAENINKNTGLTCVGILPGFGYYEDSSSDECSSSSDIDSSCGTEQALLGRKIVKKHKAV